MALAGHPNPGTEFDVITSCLRSKIETNFVPTVSFAMGILLQKSIGFQLIP